MTSAHGALDFESAGGGVDVEDAVWRVGFRGEDGGEGVEYGEVFSPEGDGVEG
jgi:hypothetical protein